ncbi:MAG: tRNA lysidine(34) synthetase TilS [Acidimicrobiales bacterium]
MANGSLTVAPPHRDLLDRCHFPSPGSPLDCAVSGGPDSLALLVLATAAGCRVTAWHVDHGLRPGSGGEAGIVADAANRYGAAFQARKVDVGKGPNLEDRARQARRAALPPRAATGHTADDQAETVLLNLIRGSGLDGLAGMRAGQVHPILGLRRSETHALCALEGLDPVQDPTNHDPAFRRNRLRAEALDVLARVGERDLVPVLARQAELLAEEADLLDELAAGLDPTDALVMAGAPIALARRAVRAWLRSGEGHPPTSADVARVLDVARGRSRATELTGGGSVKRSGQRLRRVASLAQPHPTDQPSR